jgi:suppressor of ftsI
VMPPGKRYEVLIVGSDPGTYALKTRAFDQGSAGDQYPQATLATLTSEGDEVATVGHPDGLVPENDLRERPIAETRRFVFTEKDTANKFFINGKLFDPARVDADPIVGTVEQWTLVNATEEQHPFHIHVNDFQVLSIDGEPYRARGLQDTVSLPVGAKVVILNPFEDFTGKYVFHCHILAHEDLGMMAVVDVLNERGESEAQGTHEGHGG